MTNEPARPVLGRPPVDVDDDDEELKVWVEAFIDAVLGPEADDSLFEELAPHH